MNSQREPIRVSPQEAKEIYDEEDVTVLDVIDTVSYDHFSYQIEGAVRINPEDIVDEYGKLPEDRTVLTY